IKTMLVGAAADAVAGRRVTAARAASRARTAAQEAGLLPLHWAAAMLSAGVGDGADAALAAAEVRHCAAVLRARGGGDPRTMRGYGCTVQVAPVGGGRDDDSRTAQSTRPIWWGGTIDLKHASPRRDGDTTNWGLKAR